MQIKHKVIYIHFMPPHAFLKNLHTNIKNKVPKNVYSLVGLASKNKNI